MPSAECVRTFLILGGGGSRCILAFCVLISAVRLKSKKYSRYCSRKHFQHAQRSHAHMSYQGNLLTRFKQSKITALPFTFVNEARVRDDLGLILKQTVLFAPLDLVVSSSPATPEAQQHSLPVTSLGFTVTHGVYTLKRKTSRCLCAISCISPLFVIFPFFPLQGFIFCDSLLAARSSTPACLLLLWCALDADLVMWLPSEARVVTGQPEEVGQREAACCGSLGVASSW